MQARANQRKDAPTSEARTARRLLWLIPALILLGPLTFRLILTSAPISQRLADMLVVKLARQTNAAVQLSGLRFKMNFAPCLQNLEIYRVHGPFKVEIATSEACIERWASALGSGFHAIRLRLTHPSFALEGSRAPESDPQPDLKTPSSEDGGLQKRKNRVASLREIQILFDDFRLRWKDMPFPERFSSGDFGPIDGKLTVQVRGSQSAASVFVREPNSGATINGRITPTEQGWNFRSGFEGDLVPIFRSLLKASELDIRKIPTRGEVGANYETKSGRTTIDFDLEQIDVDMASTVVSSKRLVGFTAREKLRIEIDLNQESLRISEGVLETNGIPLLLSLNIAPKDDTHWFDIQADLKTTPFARLLRSVPGSEEPEMAKDISPNTLFALSFSMAGELQRVSTWQPRLEHRFQGMTETEGTGLEFLRKPFSYYPLTKEGRKKEPLVVGPGTRGWQRYARIPYIQRRAVLVSEDSTFFYHHGIEIEEMRKAIQQAIQSGKRARGGSTLTQQLVKNLFLTRDRTALRKLQELMMTFQMESVLSKAEIFELYMNLIEWGPDIYGLYRASKYYFGQKPQNLTPRQMVYLAAIIPNPVRLHQGFLKNRGGSRARSKVKFILGRLNRLGQLDDEDFELAKKERLTFVRHRAKRKPKPAAIKD